MSTVPFVTYMNETMASEMREGAMAVFALLRTQIVSESESEVLLKRVVAKDTIATVILHMYIEEKNGHAIDDQQLYEYFFADHQHDVLDNMLETRGAVRDLKKRREAEVEPVEG